MVTSATLWLNTLRSATNATFKGEAESGAINYPLNNSQAHTSAHTCSSGIYPVKERVVPCVQHKLFPDPLQNMCLSVWENIENRRKVHTVSEILTLFI